MGDTALEEAKAASTAQLLFKVARLWNEAAVRRARIRFALPGLRPSHLALMPHLDLDGTRLTTLAERLGVSKQAAGQLVDDLVGMGLLDRRPDPADRRAVLITFTERGRRGLLEGLGELSAMEAELASVVGVEEMGELRRVLAALLPLVERA